MAGRCYATVALTATETTCDHHNLQELTQQSVAGCEAAIAYNNAQSGWTGAASLAKGSGGAVEAESTDQFVRGCYTSAFTVPEGYWLGRYNAGTGCGSSCFFLAGNYFGAYYL